MLNNIENDILIPQRSLQRYRRTVALDQQAKIAATKRIKEASQQAEAIEAMAQQQGFYQGLLMAVEALAAQIADFEQWSLKGEVRMQQALVTRLQNLLERADILPELLNAFSQSLAPVESDDKMTLTLPHHWKAQVTAMNNRLAMLTPCKLEYHYHHRDVCLIQCRDQVIEFDLSHVVETLAPQLVDKNKIRADCYQLSRNNLMAIRNSVNQQIDDLIASLSEVE